MRVTEVSLYSPSAELNKYVNAGSEAITFSLLKQDPSSRYVARSIIGIDADEIVPKFYGFGLNTKPRFYDFGMKPRDIVIRLVLNPNFYLGESYSDVRDDLYRTISSNRTGLVMLHFKSAGTVVGKISGFITKFEAVHFTKLPEVQLTIRCNDPMFRGINPVVFTPTLLGTTNPVYIPDSLSTAPHGLVFSLTFKATAAQLTIQDASANPEWKFKIIPSGGFLSGDSLYFSSELSNKYVYMVRSSVTTQLIDRIEPAAVWPVIFPGQNTFYFLEIASFNWITLQYNPAYWGV